MSLLTRSQAGLFSAVTSAFIIEVHSHLQQDPNDETAALLRVLIHKIDNTTFGNDTPTLPQWTGPPRTIVQVQAILLASLSVSLLSAFLAMLGKQWLNRFVSTDVRGTAVERNQNRQRKLDGIANWYFDHVMEALPLMLQVALLLLGCALSRYLWEIDTTVAGVVIGVTSFGMAFYILIVLAGTASESCPYQTPGARAFNYILHYPFPHIPLPTTSRLLIFVFSQLQRSWCYRLPVEWWLLLGKPRGVTVNLTLALIYIPILPMLLATDACILGVAALLLLVNLSMMVCRWLHISLATSPQTIELDVRCVSWMLQTSLDKAVHLSALKHLATMLTLGDFDPTLVSGCLDVFISCVKVDVNNHKAAVIHGSEQLAAVSAMCLLRAFHYLSVVDPASRVLGDVHRRYNRAFPLETDFWDLPFYWTVSKVHSLASQSWDPHHIQWDESGPSTQEYISFTRSITDIAQAQHAQTRKVPRWILRFVLHSLSQDLPTSIIADCLSIVAIDLGCDVSSTRTTILGERCVCTLQLTTTLIFSQCTTGTCFGTRNSKSQNNDT